MGPKKLTNIDTSNFRTLHPITSLSKIRHISMRSFDLLCSSMPYSSLPLAEALEAFHHLKAVHAKAGETIVRQDAFGDDFYMLMSGKAEVWYESDEDDTPHHVATLQAGEAFGEEGIVLGGAQYSTVIMKEPGVLVKLSGDHYRRHIARSVIQRVEPHIAKTMIDHGALLLDVRYTEEHEDVHIPGDHFIPLHELRHRVDELPDASEIVVYCRSGIRSDVGAMLLKRHGIEAVSLVGGIKKWPFEKTSPNALASKRQETASNAFWA